MTKHKWRIEKGKEEQGGKKKGGRDRDVT